MRLNFGKFKGSDIRDVPRYYLSWLVANCASAFTAAQTDELRKIVGNVPEQVSTSELKLLRERIDTLQDEVDSLKEMILSK